MNIDMKFLLELLVDFFLLFVGYCIGYSNGRNK
jgi:hypothetical protein